MRRGRGGGRSNASNGDRSTLVTRLVADTFKRKEERVFCDKSSAGSFFNPGM